MIAAFLAVVAVDRPLHAQDRALERQPASAVPDRHLVHRRHAGGPIRVRVVTRAPARDRTGGE